MRHLMSGATALFLLLPAAPSLALDGPDIGKVAAEWLYPKARDVASAGKPSLYSTMFSTPDDVSTVFRHFAKKLGIPPGNVADPGGAVGQACRRLPSPLGPPVPGHRLPRVIQDLVPSA
jgi:hypothetical protein